MCVSKKGVVVPNIVGTMTSEQKEIFIAAMFFVMDLSQNQETDYLTNRIKELGMSESALKKIKKFKSPEEAAAAIKTIKDIKLRRYILREMILVAISNHELSDEEISTIYAIGTHIGIKQEKVSDFFLWAAKGLEWEIEGLQLIEGDL